MTFLDCKEHFCKRTTGGKIGLQVSKHLKCARKYSLKYDKNFHDFWSEYYWIVYDNHILNYDLCIFVRIWLEIT